MINLSKSGNTISFSFSGNSGYLQDGTIDVPVNSLALIIDESSDMVTFKKSASNDIFISANVGDFGMTKAELEDWYKTNMVSSGGGSITVDQTVTSGSTNAVSSNAVYTQFDGIKLEQLTQAEYDALVSGGTIDNNTLYVITNS